MERHTDREMSPVRGAVLPVVILCAIALSPGNVRGELAASAYGFLDLVDPGIVYDANGLPMLTFARFDANDVAVWTQGFGSVADWCAYARSDPDLAGSKAEQIGWVLTGGDEEIFWPLQALFYLCPAYRSIVAAIESRSVLYDPFVGEWVTPRIELTEGDNVSHQPSATVRWNPAIASVFDRSRRWHSFPPLVGLAHELVHAQQRVLEDKFTYVSSMQIDAMKGENLARYAFYRKVPGHADLRPRPGNQGFYLNGQFQSYFDDIEWADWSPAFSPLLDVFGEE